MSEGFKPIETQEELNAIIQKRVDQAKRSAEQELGSKYADYEVLKQRMIDCGMNIENYQWYLDLRKYGSAPSSGFGLGFERLVMYVTGMDNIRDVIPYARTAKNLEY